MISIWLVAVFVFDFLTWNWGNNSMKNKCAINVSSHVLLNIWIGEPKWKSHSSATLKTLHSKTSGQSVTNYTVSIILFQEWGLLKRLHQNVEGTWCSTQDGSKVEITRDQRLHSLHYKMVSRNTKPLSTLLQAATIVQFCSSTNKG